MEARIIYIMGVSGAGKTLIGKILSERTGIPFFDADDFHPEANKIKMSSGKPLDDNDRNGWLLRLHELTLEEARKKGAIIACSALKEKYRRTLDTGIPAPVDWVWLNGNYELILQRLQERKGHFMPESLLRSQFETMEPPGNALVIDIGKSPENIVSEIQTALLL
jgi:carbohydrate kinase (thermoresistant glucokinase family)